LICSKKIKNSDFWHHFINYPGKNLLKTLEKTWNNKKIKNYLTPFLVYPYVNCLRELFQYLIDKKEQIVTPLILDLFMYLNGVIFQAHCVNFEIKK
jgi:hypothetical protein